MPKRRGMRSGHSLVVLAATVYATQNFPCVSAQDEGENKVGAAVTAGIISVLFVAFTLTFGYYIRRRKDMQRRKERLQNNNGTLRPKRTVVPKKSAVSFVWSTLGGGNGTAKVSRLKAQQQQRALQQQQQQQQQQKNTHREAPPPAPQIPQVQMTRPSLFQRVMPQYVVDWFANYNYPLHTESVSPMRSPGGMYNANNVAPGAPNQAIRYSSYTLASSNSPLSMTRKSSPVKNKMPKAPSSVMEPTSPQLRANQIQRAPSRSTNRNQRQSSFDPRNEYPTSSTAPRRQLSTVTSHSPAIHVASRGTQKRVASSMMPQIGSPSAGPGRQVNIMYSPNKNRPNTSLMPQLGVASTPFGGQQQSQRGQEYSAAPNLRPSSLSPLNLQSYTSKSPGI
jgi:hypothetical protein